MTASPKSRRRVLVGVSAVATLSLGVGVAAGSRLTSPADAAARTAPPKASQITVPVEKRALSSKVVARGDTSFDGAVNVRVETSGLQNAGGGDGQGADGRLDRSRRARPCWRSPAAR